MLKFYIELNSNIRNIHPSKTYGSSIEIPELGITTSTSINQLIEGGVLPNGYTIELWCNTETYWGNEIREKLKSRYSVDFFGYVTMHRSFDGNFVTIECRPFNTNDIYLNGWTNVNNMGWHAHWDKVSLV